MNIFIKLIVLFIIIIILRSIFLYFFKKNEYFQASYNNEQDNCWTLNNYNKYISGEINYNEASKNSKNNNSNSNEINDDYYLDSESCTIKHDSEEQLQNHSNQNIKQEEEMLGEYQENEESEIKDYRYFNKDKKFHDDYKYFYDNLIEDENLDKPNNIIQNDQFPIENTYKNNSLNYQEQEQQEEFIQNGIENDIISSEFNYLPTNQSNQYNLLNNQNLIEEISSESQNNNRNREGYYNENKMYKNLNKPIDCIPKISWRSGNKNDFYIDEQISEESPSKTTFRFNRDNQYNSTIQEYNHLQKNLNQQNNNSIVEEEQQENFNANNYIQFKKIKIQNDQDILNDLYSEQEDINFELELDTYDLINEDKSNYSYIYPEQEQFLYPTSNDPMIFSESYPNNQDCKPSCKWKCKMPPNELCQQRCKPICKKNNCRVKCEKLKPPTCKVECQDPICRTVCPTDRDICYNNQCPPCKTICDEPICNVKCTKSKPVCKTICDKPTCKWKCFKPTNCPPPTCELVCDESIIDNEFCIPSENSIDTDLYSNQLPKCSPK